MVRLLSEQCLRPWAIVRILPKAQRCTVARFRNRQDADDHMRLLRRFIRAALFEIIFDSPIHRFMESPFLISPQGNTTQQAIYVRHNFDIGC